MLLAGGQGSRLHALTSHVAKPAVPWAENTVVDFPLSNCINSGIDTVGVLTQYRPLELNAYLGNGQAVGSGPLRRGRAYSPPICVKGKRAPGTRAPPTPFIRTSALLSSMTRNMFSSSRATTFYKIGLFQDTGPSQSQRRGLHHLGAGGHAGGGHPLRHHECGQLRPGCSMNLRRNPSIPRATWPPWASTSSPGPSSRSI